jgi:ABC-type sugar transport system substrate-binding protein
MAGTFLAAKFLEVGERSYEPSNEMYKENVMNTRSYRARFTRSLLVFLTMFWLFGFPDSAPARPQAEINRQSGGMKIGFVCHNPYQTYYQQGVRYDDDTRRFQEILYEFSVEKEFTLVDMVSHTPFCDPVPSVQYLIAQAVDAVVFCFEEPPSAVRAVSEAQAAGIPIVLYGANQPFEIHAPLVGSDAYHIGIETGERTAELFKRRFPARQPKLLIADFEMGSENADLEKGFVEGIMRLLPDIYIQRTSEETGYPENMFNSVFEAVRENPDLNIFFGTSDTTTTFIMLALQNCGRGTPETEIVAGYGGSEAAMEELIKPESAWKIEAAIPIAEHVRKTYELIDRMLSGKMPLHSTDRYLLDAEYFVEPSVREIHEYLYRHGAIGD